MWGPLGFDVVMAMGFDVGSGSATAIDGSSSTSYKFDRLTALNPEDAEARQLIEQARELLEPLCCNRELRALIHAMPRVIARPTAVVRWGSSTGGSQLFSVLSEGHLPESGLPKKSDRCVSDDLRNGESELSHSQLQGRHTLDACPR